MKKQSKTFNVCYLREYMDPEHQGEFFYAYETIYRNVPEKYRSKFNNQDPNATIRKTLVPEKYKKETLKIKKGSVLLIHSWLVHASHKNNSNGNRYALLCTYLKEHSDFRKGEYAKRIPFPLVDKI